METNTGLIIKLCVFALDMFVLVFNFLTLKYYFPSFGQKDKHVEVKNKAQQTYMAGDSEQKGVNKRQNYPYRTTNPLSKNLPSNSSCTRPKQSQKYNPDRDRDYKKEDRYSKSVCHCDFCREGKPNGV